MDKENKDIYKMAIFPYLILTIGFVIYSVVWSIISIDRLYSFNALTLDLGIQMERIWAVYHVHINLIQFIYYFSTYGLVVIFSPLSFFKNYSLLLVIQTLGIGFSVFPLFYIFKKKLQNEAVALILASSFLLYFPLAGPNFYDFHFQTFFMVFFLSAYALYVRGNYRASFFVFLLAGLSEHYYILLVIIFSVTEIIILYLKRKNDRIALMTVSVLLVTSMMIFLIGNAYVGLSGLVNVPSVHSTSILANLEDHLQNKIQVFLVILAPLLFLPILSTRWLPLMAPFAIWVLITSGTANTYYPNILHYQLMSMIIPFLYLGLGDGVNVLLRESSSKKVATKTSLSSSKRLLDKQKKYIRFSYPKKRNIFIIPVAIFVVVLLFATVYEPYSPLNSDINEGFDHMFASTPYNDINMTQYVEFQYILNLIPKNNNSVLFQTNLPEVLPRYPIDGNYSYGYVVPSTGQPDLSWGNIGVGNAINNSYPGYIVHNGKKIWTNVSLWWAIADTNSFWFKVGGAGSMYNFMSCMLQSGKYGIVAESGGFLLMERGFHGQVRFFIPSTNSYQPADTNTKYYNRALNSYLIDDVSSRSYVGNFQLGVLSPGYYKVTISGYARDISRDNSLQMIVNGYSSSNITNLVSLVLNGSSINESAGKISYEFYFHTSNLYVNSLLAIYVEYWWGFLAINGVEMTITPATITGN
ncbi:MAG: DUF2079 domain-containing protein [Candidatus Thermoplasmatota archaeon]|jgi:uncharacterized membrane protein|nr:DUF2079 domain-containing protein [Candidatus Thermoplasmatota archaeon]